MLTPRRYRLVIDVCRPFRPPQHFWFRNSGNPRWKTLRAEHLLREPPCCEKRSFSKAPLVGEMWSGDPPSRSRLAVCQWPTAAILATGKQGIRPRLPAVSRRCGGGSTGPRISVLLCIFCTSLPEGSIRISISCAMRRGTQAPECRAWWLFCHTRLDVGLPESLQAEAKGQKHQHRF